MLDEEIFHGPQEGPGRINLLRMRLHLRQDTRHCGEQRTKAFEEAVVSFTLARVLRSRSVGFSSKLASCNGEYSMNSKISKGQPQCAICL